MELGRTRGPSPACGTVSRSTPLNGAIGAPWRGALPTEDYADISVTVADSIGSTVATGIVAVRSTGGTRFVTTTLATIVANRPARPIGHRRRRARPISGQGLRRTERDDDFADERLDRPDHRYTDRGRNYRLEIEVAATTVGDPASLRCYRSSSNPALVIAPLALPNGMVDRAYPSGSKLSVSGGAAPYTWTVTGLPSGLTLAGDPAGTERPVAGAPTAASTGSVSVSVTDASGITVQASQPLMIAADLTVSTAAVPGKTYTNADIAGAVTSQGGNQPITYTATGLPNGISMSTAGVLSGQATITPQTVTVTYQATDGAGYATTATSDLRVIAPLAANTGQLLNTVAAGRQYRGSVAATGGIAPYSFSIATASQSPLPAYVALDPVTGLFNGAGVPAADGSVDLVVTIADSDGKTVAVPYTLTVSATAPVSVSVASTNTVATNGVAYSQQATASGGIAPYTWSLINAPAWLSISNTGLVSGTPTGGNAAVTFTIKATAGIFEGTRDVTVDVRAPLAIDVTGLPTTLTAGDTSQASLRSLGAATLRSPSTACPLP